MPEYSNTDATAYLLEKVSKFESDTYKLRYILAGVFTVVGGIVD